MILEELVLHNFGVFRGRQSICLDPPQPSRPIILFGGMNGGGKTTILDALQLVLYGKFARCSTRQGSPYETFLLNSINRFAERSEGAAVELKFRHVSEGTLHTYRLHRSWSSTASSVRERFEVVADERQDAILADSWNEHVERFIPSRISSLFFFDGEKIEAMADPETASQTLAAGIQALLGLDLVDKLGSDLMVLERRRQSDSGAATDSTDMRRLQRDVEEAEEVRLRLHSERASAQTELDRQLKHLRDLEERFRGEGGNLFEQRELLEFEKKDCLAKVGTLTDELRDLAAGPVPLLLIPGLLRELNAQAKQEQISHRSQLLKSLLLERDQRVLSALEKQNTPNVILSKVRNLLDEDRKTYGSSRSNSYLNLDDESAGNITGLLGPLADELRARIGSLTDQVSRLENALVDLDRSLVQVPPAEAIAALLKNREEAQLAAARAAARLEAVDADLERARKEVEQRNARLARLAESDALVALGKEDSLRVVSHSRRVRDTLKLFRTGIVKRNIRRIEAIVLDKLKQLLRKESLIGDLKIDPESFRITLLAPDGGVVEAERLSAGERQLLAVALLWGLANASGRPLPTVIDTPLGRLDSCHRANLVDRYFPRAGHQVLLLSTDEEIDEGHYRKLRPSIGRSYLLDFDDRRGETHIRSGYFW